MLCDLRVEVQRDIEKLLEVQPVPILRERPDCDDKKDFAFLKTKSCRLVTLLDAKVELRSKIF